MPPQITALLTNRDLDRLARLRLNASRRFTNRSRGEHLAAKGGTSTEFCDYRDYSPGDDARFVDWNIFARIERPYLKLFHQEEEMHLALLVDASRSMMFEGKLELATRLAAALGVLGLRGSEKVSACALGRGTALPAHEKQLGLEAPSDRLEARPTSRLAPCRGRMATGKLFAFLEGIAGGGDTPVEQGIEHFLRRHSGRGTVVVISDFLTGGDLRRAFNLLHSAGLEIWAIQILGPGELDPELNGDLRLIDCETLGNLDISSAGDLLALYHEHRAAHQAHLAALCQQRHGRCLSISAAEPIERVVFDLMRRKGWIV